MQKKILVVTVTVYRSNHGNGIIIAAAFGNYVTVAQLGSVPDFLPFIHFGECGPLI